MLARSTPAGLIANIAAVGIENARILLKCAKGEIGFTQALDSMGRTTVSMAAGLFAAFKGAKLGAVAGSFVPVIGTAIGTVAGFIGGAVAYVAGSEIGSAVYSAAKTVASSAKSFVQSAYNAVKSVGAAVCSGVKSVAKAVTGAVTTAIGNAADKIFNAVFG